MTNFTKLNEINRPPYNVKLRFYTDVLTPIQSKGDEFIFEIVKDEPGSIHTDFDVKSDYRGFFVFDDTLCAFLKSHGITQLEECLYNFTIDCSSKHYDLLPRINRYATGVESRADMDINLLFNKKMGLENINYRFWTCIIFRSQNCRNDITCRQNQKFINRYYPFTKFRRICSFCSENTYKI